MDFAKNLMEAQGWSEGQGLGRSTEGRSEAIKVKLKFDKAGIGGNGSEEFTFPWWDHAFNRAAANIVIDDDSDDDEIKVKSNKDLGKVSSKEPKEREKKRFYGMFVKAKPLGGSDNDVDEDKSYAKQMTDQELFEACGGLTGHKAARHGHQLSGKLKRIKEAEADAKVVERLRAANRAIVERHSDQEVKAKKAKKKKHKAKKRKGEADADKSDSIGDSQDTASSEVEDKDARKRRKAAKRAKKAKQAALPDASDEIPSGKRAKRTDSTIPDNSDKKTKRKANKAKKSKKKARKDT
eukprot:TRINITY_DN5439_c0_g1_i1.p1 TRINITY_DN5439_c0_g1~~TRINITY_DN5439_c0_g1_i1.p1  ORF type:complete len:319 (+),score=85.73 TRINITY_DN5439_c0_g1_i1:74-958(+)